MNPTTVVIVLGVLVAGLGLLIYVIVRSSRQAAERRQQLQEMGFEPLETDDELTNRISALYRRVDPTTGRFELRDVARRALPDGEMYILDVLEHSREDHVWQAKQTVAVSSSRLNLPHFVLTPKSDMNNWAAALADRVIGWAATAYGPAVTFPDAPQFEQRYNVNSTAPDEARRFLTGDLLQHLADTRYTCMHARGSVFTLTEMGTQPSTRYPTPEQLRERVERATTIHSLLTRHFG
ncbi:MAG: hypothetical protein JNM56_16690 [Planctomycetia bacterium]|nr:hypothetical protein [Planctomycetia bacterium]